MNKHYKTPTFALTALGLLSLAFAVRHKSGADLAAFACFGMAAGGIAIALDRETKRKGEEWNWGGIARSLRHPSRDFWIGFATHTPQLIATGWIAWHWRKHK